MNNNEKTRRVRKTKDISQKAIAIELGISQSAVSKLERGHTKMTETKMKEFADKLGVTPEEIKKFDGNNVSINIEVDGDNSGNNGNVNLDQVKLYEQMLQDKECIIEAKDVALEAKDVALEAKDIVISLLQANNNALQARINELLEKEK